MSSAIHDQLIAAIVVMGAFLTTGSWLHQRASDSASQVQLSATHASLSGFTEVLEQDIRSIGSGVVAGAPMIFTFDVDEFSFSGTADSTRAARTILYTRTPATPGPGGEPRYVLTRTVNGAVTSSSPPLTAAGFVLLDDANNPVGTGTLEQARRVQVHLEVPPPFETLPDAAVQRVVWATEVAPPNLARRNAAAESHPMLSTNATVTEYGT